MLYPCTFICGSCSWLPVPLVAFVSLRFSRLATGDQLGVKVRLDGQLEEL